MNEIIIIAAAVLVALIGALFYVQDKQRARYMALQEIMRTYMRKALHDRNDKVRIPAAQVQEMFDLDEVRVIPRWKAPYREHRHPATQPPNRGKG